MFGVAGLVVVWCVVAVWIGRLAVDRGRSVLFWVVAGAAASGSGVLVALYGVTLFVDISDNLTLLWCALFAVFVFGPPGLVALVLAALPIHVKARIRWSVNTRTLGTGSLEIRSDSASFQWPGLTQDVPLDRVCKLEPDGECLRIMWDDAGREAELLIMPMEEPQTRAGRQQQCRTLRDQLTRRV